MSKIINPLGLTEKQKELFKNFEKAYKACLRAKINIVNNYGFIEAYNKEWVRQYTDGTLGKGTFIEENSIETTNVSAEYYFHNHNLNSWADDTHIIEFTEKGKKLYDEYNEQL